MTSAIRFVSFMALAVSAAVAHATEAPPLPAPARWDGASAGHLVASVDDRWWLAFNDADLNHVIALAGTADDVDLAGARLREAIARLGSARSDLGPSLGLSAGADRQKIDALERHQIDVALALAWSPDLSGSRRLRARAAAARVAGEQARLAAIRQTTRATAARLYVAWKENTLQAAAADRLVAAREQQWGLDASLERAGLSSGLEPSAAEASLAGARQLRDAARERADNARLGLEGLVGLAAGSLKTEAATLRIPLPAASARTLLAPLSVLALRPDLRALDLDLVAAGMAARASRRDFWPDLSIGAALGIADVNQGGPIKTSGLLTGLVGSLVAPLFNSGQLSSARDLADAQRDAAMVRYRQATRSALAEVEQAVISDGSANTKLQDAVAVLDVARRRAELVASRHRAGLVSFEQVVQLQDETARAEMGLASAQAYKARAVIALSSAMGLGAAP